MPINLFATHESYTKEAIDFFKDGFSRGLTQDQIRKQLKDEIRDFHLLDSKQAARLDRDMNDCKSPCAFIINLYLKVNYPEFGYVHHPRIFCAIYSLVREIAPEFIGMEETKAFFILERWALTQNSVH